MYKKTKTVFMNKEFSKEFEGDLDVEIGDYFVLNDPEVKYEVIKIKSCFSVYDEDDCLRLVKRKFVIVEENDWNIGCE